MGMTILNRENAGEIIIDEFSELNSEIVEPNVDKRYLLNKRLIDIFGALLGIMILFPLFILIFLLIKIEDLKSPAIFKQKRVGRNGEEFYIYKFRSMVNNAEDLKFSLVRFNEVTGPVFKIKQDPRVTKIGKIIRKTSIDELPQLFNVLKGEMSLVGPRPPLPNEVELYSSYEKQRISVTPGLTCYWQVNGRSNVGFQRWVDMDLEYIRQRNTLVDIKLILKTVIVLFGSRDAC